MWQVKWFRYSIYFFCAFVGAGMIFLFVKDKYFSQNYSPTPQQNFENPPLRLEGELPEPRTLGVKTKDTSTDPILMYHHISSVPSFSDKVSRELNVAPNNFNEQLQYLNKAGYSSALPSELFNDLPSKKVIITFDDGYSDIIENALPIMSSLGFRGTVFVIVSSIGKPGYLSWDDLKKLQYEGWHVGSHTLSHLNLKQFDEATSKIEITESKAVLEQKLGTPIRYFCYPLGKYKPQDVEAVKTAGYSMAFTVNYGTVNTTANIYELKRIRINGSESIEGFKSRFK